MTYLAHEETPAEEHKVDPGDQQGDDGEQGARDAGPPGSAALLDGAVPVAAQDECGPTPTAAMQVGSRLC